MHGGTMQAFSEGHGRGSEFVVHLPVLLDQPPPLPQPAASSVGKPMPTSGRRILVVDDNRDAGDSLLMLLKMAGNDTRIAYDGLEAVDAAATFRPDVILLDIGLPKLNGYDVCRRIREQPWGKDIAVLALTGWGQDEDRRKSKEAGFNGHLVKPVEHAALMEMLADIER
jgi:CheY-like chemotaxis protein